MRAGDVYWVLGIGDVGCCGVIPAGTVKIVRSCSTSTVLWRHTWCHLWTVALAEYSGNENADTFEHA